MATQTVKAAAHPPAGHVRILDYLRGVAILLVMVYHALFQGYHRDQLDWSGWTRDFHAPASFLALYPLTWGWCGVAIFFVISGFCIHLSFLRSSGGLREFFVRRLFRIYPPYLAALAFFVLFFPRTHLAFHSTYDFEQLFSHLLLVQNADSRAMHGICVAWWSIAVEFQLYLIYPLLLLLVRRWGWNRAIFVVACIELLLRCVDDGMILDGIHSVPSWLENSPFTFWFSWAIGAWIAEAYARGEPLPLVRQPVSLWIGLFVVGDLFEPLQPFTFTFAAVSTAILLARHLQTSDAPARPSGLLPRMLGFIGLVSYSLYLVHLPFIESVPDFMGGWFSALSPVERLLCCLLAGALVVPFAWLLYRFTELPAITAGKKVAAALRFRGSAGPTGVGATQ